MKTWTPWGAPDFSKSLASGIEWYSTPSHGGLWLSEERRAEMPADLRAVKTWAGLGWYEEDCDVAIVVLAFPYVFKPHDYVTAVETCASFHKEVATKERVQVAKWLKEAYLSDKYVKAMEVGTPGKGWTVSARHCVTNEEIEHTFPRCPILPSVFTKEEFFNAKCVELPTHSSTVTTGDDGYADV